MILSLDYFEIVDFDDHSSIIVLEAFLCLIKHIFKIRESILNIMGILLKILEIPKNPLIMLGYWRVNHHNSAS